MFGQSVIWYHHRGNKLVLSTSGELPHQADKMALAVQTLAMAFQAPSLAPLRQSASVRMGAMEDLESLAKASNPVVGY